MPATRARSIAPRFDSYKPASTTSTKPSSPLTVKRKDGTQPKERPQKLAIDPSDIIEISDDDEPLRHLDSQTSKIANFRRQINMLREESVKHKKEYECQINKLREESVKHMKDHERLVREVNFLREENQKLQALRKPGTQVDVAQLTDNMDCDICTSRLWEPYSLPECGHLFCQSCLQDWFGTTLAQFMNAHPHYDVNQAQNIPHLQHLFETLIQNPRAATNPQVAGMLANILPPSPQYTCPTCREPVRTRPIEVFALKAIVRVVTTAAGESSPKKTVAKNWKGKTGPWDGFFPLKKTLE